MNEPATITALLHAKTIAVIGLSADAAKPSHYVPGVPAIGRSPPSASQPVCRRGAGRKGLRKPDRAAGTSRPRARLRLPKFIPAIVDEMIELKLPALWVQLGIVNDEAGAKAEAHGIQVVMDRCMMVESRRANIHL